MKTNQIKDRINRLYNLLFSAYGPQGWWPLIVSRESEDDLNSGYHPGEFDFPGNDRQRLEICIGAVLTQNTTWKNVEKVLYTIKELDLLSKKQLSDIPHGKLAEVIRSVGYFNQKATYLKNLIQFLYHHSIDDLLSEPLEAVRTKLLNVKGIGRETADCILLYAFNQCSFVVDAYTMRFLLQLKIIEKQTKYDEVRAIFEASLVPDFRIYQEYHALFVAHGKAFYSKKPFGRDDPILSHMRKLFPR
jgi:endonuclease-3 related protein